MNLYNIIVIIVLGTLCMCSAIGMYKHGQDMIRQQNEKWRRYKIQGEIREKHPNVSK